MRRTYNEWADTVNNLPYDLVLVDMLSDWQADGIRLTKCINNLESRIAELEAELTKGHELQDSYCDRIAGLKDFINQLIEAGSDAIDWCDIGGFVQTWQALVKDRKEG